MPTYTVEQPKRWCAWSCSAASFAEQPMKIARHLSVRAYDVATTLLSFALLTCKRWPQGYLLGACLQLVTWHVQPPSLKHYHKHPHHDGIIYMYSHLPLHCAATAERHSTEWLVPPAQVLEWRSSSAGIGGCHPGLCAIPLGWQG